MQYFDELETAVPDEREARLMSALSAQVAHAKRGSRYFAELLAAIDPREVSSRRALATLPVTRKSQLLQRQAADLPFGGLSTVARGELARIFSSPGPIYEPEGRRPDYWRSARALFAAGFRSGDVVHNSYSYHLTPAGSVFETGAHFLGCAVVPGGVGQTELQVRAIADIKPDGYVGTPSFLRILLEKAAETGSDVASIHKALVSGEALLPPVRTALRQAGIAVCQCYATADLGVIAYESSSQSGLIIDEQVILEIVNPGTGDLVEEGAAGEVVVTVLSADYPLIRFATGDLSAFLHGVSPCGRTNQRIKGWLGRADQSTKVRGMFVHPAQIEEVMRRHSEIRAARMVVSRDAHGNDEMVLKVEVQGSLTEPTRVAETIQAITRLRSTVETVPNGSLPRDGVLVADARS